MWARAEFSDRREAGRELAQALAHLKGVDALVLALPRGGVPVGFEVAQALDAELDVLVVRKIGAPGHKELGIGAVADGEEPQLIINQDVMAMTGATADYIEQEKKRQLEEIERRKRVYRGDRPDPVVIGRTVIVVDDGIATGGTMKVALKSLRQRKPAHLVMAVPVAAQDSLTECSALADETICILHPTTFYAVGQFYTEFGQTEDDEVVQLLVDARRHHEASRAKARPT